MSVLLHIIQLIVHYSRLTVHEQSMENVFLLIAKSPIRKLQTWRSKNTSEPNCIQLILSQLSHSQFAYILFEAVRGW
ncbi:hypothetical protein T01_4853 [Trichinella spiralis]|uniref:Uncharacterized protein n=1 Tax=Trichinella spiralis TaxID=6334 RepID=A0A0V1C290_TRISP|nr:hypothetical protein T01_4853 [Trichinella spiralis]